MNELKLRALSCPQCGAPSVVREGTRITACDRCGATLCLTETAYPKYEAEANLSAVQAAAAARSWLDKRNQSGVLGRPELVLVPYHEISGRRVGVFERKIPVRREIHRSIYNPQTGGPDVETKVVFDQKEDTKVMVSDVQHITPATRTPWDLGMFEASAARRTCQLRNFDLVEAQRRATVYAEDQTPEARAYQRFSVRGDSEMVAASRRTLFFPFWSFSVQLETGSYEMVIDGINGNVVAWRLPEVYQASSLNWALLAVPGALGLGQFLRSMLFDTSMIPPFVALVIGGAATVAAFIRSSRPDWSIRSWPEPGSMAKAGS